ncbi:hypothetical protein ACJMK2_043223 [Sinanodonta woodiana]|uniref:Uncharacterized protein n=1 Tax=Sinanodonta woodiana TaxID=1069815 RepID=A0ABD3VW86_SINWO
MRAILWIVVIMFATYHVQAIPRFRGNIACPLLKCQEIAPECAQPTYFRVRGSMCRGCDSDTCITSAVCNLVIFGSNTLNIDLKTALFGT